MTRKEANEFWGRFNALGHVTATNVKEWENLIGSLVGQSLIYGTPALGEKMRTVTITAFDPVERFVTVNDDELGFDKWAMRFVIQNIGNHYWNFIITGAA